MKKLNRPSGVLDAARFGHMMASGDDATTLDAKAVAGIRENGTKMVTALNSMLDFLDAPLRAEFLKVKSEIDTVLAGLPPSDQAPAALDAHHILGRLFDMFASAQSLMTNVNEALGQAKAQGMAMAKAEAAEAVADPAVIETAAASKVAELLASGEYVKKDVIDTLVTAGIDAAAQQAKEREILLNARKEALTTAGLPLPESLEVLEGDDAAFTALKTAVGERATFLKEKGVRDAQILTLCYGEQAAFDASKALLDGGFVAASSPTPARRGPDPFIAGKHTKSANGASKIADIRKLGVF